MSPEQVESVRVALTRKPQTIDDIRVSVAMSRADTIDALTIIRRARKVRRTYDPKRTGYVYTATGRPS